eukprot:518203-Rhodomonas_salina.2
MRYCVQVYATAKWFGHEAGSSSESRPLPKSVSVPVLLSPFTPEFLLPRLVPACRMCYACPVLTVPLAQ